MAIQESFWRCSGVIRESGEPTDIVVRATDEELAILTANSQGVLVETVEPIATAVTPSDPAAQMIARMMLGGCCGGFCGWVLAMLFPALPWFISVTIAILLGLWIAQAIEQRTSSSGGRPAG